MNSAFAIDLQAGDLMPQAEGTQAVQVAFGQVERNDRYVDGRRVSSAPEVQSDIAHIRYVRYLKVADMPAVACVQQPWGRTDVQGMPGVNAHASGRADPIFLFGLWPYANRETNTYLAMAAYYFSGSGSYEGRNLSNIGENRNRTALQVAYQTRIASNLDWMAAADVTRFGVNSDYSAASATLEQKKLYSLQTAFIYHLNPQTSLALSLFRTTGGETILNGNARNDETRVNRGMMTLIYRLPQYRTAFHLQYGRDFNTENGFLETRRVMLRMTRSF